MTQTSKKNLIIWCCITLLMLFSSTTFINAQASSLETYTTNYVNVRSGPGVDWRLMGVLDPGVTVLLDGLAYEGTWVRGISSTGVMGWMLAENLAASAEQIDTLRSIWIEEPFTLSAPAQQEGLPIAPPPAQAEAQPEPQPTQQQQAPAAGGSATGGMSAYVTDQVNLRGGPGGRYNIITTLNYNDTLLLDGRDSTGNWARGVTANGLVGWVSSAYIVLEGRFADLSVVQADSPFTLNVPTVASAPAETTSGTAPTATPEPVVAVANTAPVRGFAYGGHVAGFNETSANWMRVAGMTWIKKQVRYVDNQNPADFAGLINDAHAKGFRVLLGVVGFYPSDINNQGYFDRYASFVAGLAAQGADGIEIWNEPNIDREWPAGSIDPARYTELLRASYNAIKNANANTLVVSGAPAPTGFFGGCSGNGCDDNYFLAGMRDAGAARYMDCVGIHYNEGIVPPTATSGDPRGSSDHYTRYLRSMMNVYYGALRKPLCFTELGYLTPEGYGALPGNFAWAGDVTVAQQAAWLDGAVEIARNSGQVRLVIIWNVDFTDYGADPMAGYAMIRPGGGCPACEALGN